MKKFLTLFLICLSFSLESQVQLSVYSEVSIVTCSSGDELFEAFGHSAIRIKDPVLQLDLVYNYGIFDFNSPNFYTNFAKGKLLYKLGRYQFNYFLESYAKDKRWVKEQILNISQEQKQEFFKFLELNAAPQNASYLYDPFYNNCASKLRDITKSVLKDKVSFSDINLPKKETLRTLMNNEIYWNTWGSCGINLALGNKLDKEITTEQFMYLPYFVYAIFKNSTILVDGKPESLIKKENILLGYSDKKTKFEWLNPLLIFSVLSLLGIWITFKDYKNRKRNKFLDFVIFSITGLIGVLLTFLWFFTDHSTTPNNFNVFWVFPFNFLALFFILKNQPKKWILYYLYLLVVFILLIPIFWILEIQLFPKAVIPILILLQIRYLFLIKYFKVAHQ